MTEWYYIPTTITCPELKGPGLLDEVSKIERLDETRLRRRRSR